MRLLRLQDDGELNLVEYVGNLIPPYAILSHTWGPDHEEVTFEDLIEGVGKNKAGYGKLTFCAKQVTYSTIAYSFSGSTLAASTKVVAQSYLRLLIQCFDGTRMRRFVLHI